MSTYIEVVRASLCPAGKKATRVGSSCSLVPISSEEWKNSSEESNETSEEWFKTSEEFSVSSVENFNFLGRKSEKSRKLLKKEKPLR